ncbi:MAG: hypothetical protein L3J39_03905 [Verrucomicrobiales bacterium]|nr:hypothetical protein [Verrucomicrobiales bacterium]
MTETTTDEILAEVWNAKDSLSAKFGHNLAATCRSLYAEQAKTPERFVSFGVTRKAQQDAAEQPASRPVVENN